MGRTQNFDLERRSCDQLKLSDIINYDFYFELISSFFWFVFQNSSYSCKCICKIMIYVSPIRSSRKEKFCQIYMAYVYAVTVALIPVASSNESSLRIVVSVPAEEHNIHI
jgi:hypothetical protein